MPRRDPRRNKTPGSQSLWQSVLERTTRAAHSGALHSIATHCEVIEQGDVAFAVRVAANFEQKLEAAGAQRRVGVNPFLPYDEDLFVADISDTHVCLLNKFNAVAHHVLIVTREFERQENPLNLHDLEALWTCMADIDGIGFYNSGLIAGASQDHKHLQLVPLPLGPGPEPTPVDPVLASATFEGTLGSVPGLPFVHAAARFDPAPPRSPAEAADYTLDLHHQLLRAIGCHRSSRPYNLLVTRNWMLAVPRTRESFESIPVNALGFAGSLFVRNREQLDFVRSCGPMTILENVARARG
jgi:ATP adenylyltransferase